jgi:hypothetical protein
MGQSCTDWRLLPCTEMNRTGDFFNSHTRHTLSAATEVTKMLTDAVPLTSHTHFFTCVITLASIVHLSRWALSFLPDEEDLRQQIRLNIGALAKLSEVWKAAHTAGEQVKGVAQEIYRAKRSQQINPAFWVGFTQEQMISSINADEGIMSDFESILPAAAAVAAAAAAAGAHPQAQLGQQMPQPQLPPDLTGNGPIPPASLPPGTEGP